jgi:outer membrane protein assembly factor BamB
VDAATGRPVWSVPLRLEARAAVGAPGVVALAGEDTATIARRTLVVGVRASDGHTLWRRPLPGRYRAAEANLGVLYVLHADTTAQAKPFTVTAISLASGEAMATRTFEGSLLPQVVAADDAVLLVEPSRGREEARRHLVTMDGTTLALRNRVPLRSPSSPFYVHPPMSSVVVTTDGTGALTAVDVTRGEPAWSANPVLPEGRGVKAMFGVAGGVVVTDDRDGVAMVDADDGRERWRKSLAPLGSLVYQGEAAEGDLVVATVKPRAGDGRRAIAVALDAETGAERWRASIPLADENTYPHPEILAGVVCYELNERLAQEMQSRVVLLDRRDGRVVQEVAHPTIGRTYQRVVYGSDWIGLSSTNEFALYGPAARGK